MDKKRRPYRQRWRSGCGYGRSWRGNNGRVITSTDHADQVPWSGTALSSNTVDICMVMTHRDMSVTRCLYDIGQDESEDHIINECENESS